jgi:malonyl-CoA O-methyltransferase
MLDHAVRWIVKHSIPNQGVVVTSRRRHSYPEVTGYMIPTLLSVGKRELARQYAAWLTSIQHADGSFGGGTDGRSYAFDTGQVIRGWAALLDRMPGLETPLRRACDWLIDSADASTGRLPVPPPRADWSLGARGEVSEGIHLYVLPPLRRAGELLNEPRYGAFVAKALRYYLTNVPLTEFAQSNALTHFFAYIQEALIDLGEGDRAAAGMKSVERYQQKTGAVPGYADVNWVCSTGQAQLGMVWHRLGQLDRAEAALAFLEQLQNPSGGFFGSYGVGASYFPAEEISWAAKYAIEATQHRIAGHFDATAGAYDPSVSVQDPRAQAMLRHLDRLEGKRVLDAGCGKGRYSALVKRTFPSAHITALDISAEMLKHVPAGIRTVQRSLLSMPFDDGAFDVVFCIEALEHAVDIGQAVKELARVTAPGGMLLIIDKDRERLGALSMPSWEQWFGRDELSRLVQDHGFTVQIDPINRGGPGVPEGLFVCWVGRKGG